MNYTVEEEQKFKLQIRDIVSKNPHGYTTHIKNDVLLMEYINFKTPLLQEDFYKLQTKLYWVLNDLIDFPKCPYCQKQDKYIHSNVRNVNLGYRNHCSTRCSSLDREVQIKGEKTRLQLYNDSGYRNHEQAVKTTLERYGVSCIFSSDAFKEIIKETNLKLYGAENVFSSEQIKEKIRQTTLERYGVENVLMSSEFREKARMTMLERYGVDHNFKIPECKEKIRQTRFEKYGTYGTPKSSLETAFFNSYGLSVDTPFLIPECREKIRQTTLERYGVENVLMYPEFREKARMTMLERYGVDHASKSIDFRRKSMTKYTYNDVTFDSLPELAVYIFLTDNNVEFEYQPDLKYSYEIQGQTHIYYPDFKVGDQVWEIKGKHFIKEDGSWQNPWNHDLDYQVEAKHQCILENNVLVISDYSEYINYVNDKYGKEYLHQFKNN